LSPSRENKAFLLSKKPKEGKGLECIFPVYHFCLQHLAGKIRYFYNWELKAGKGNVAKRMEGYCMILFVSFFK
jgi:hypothetical protein